MKSLELLSVILNILGVMSVFAVVILYFPSLGEVDEAESFKPRYAGSNVAQENTVASGSR